MELSMRYVLLTLAMLSLSGCYYDGDYGHRDWHRHYGYYQPYYGHRGWRR